MSETAPEPAEPLAARVERRLLDGAPHLTRAELADEVGLPPDTLTALWRALGFAVVGDDVPAFTEADARALRDVAALTGSADLDEQSLQAMTRMLGQAFSRLATWQAQFVVELLGRSPQLWAGDGGRVDTDRVVGLLEQILPPVARLQDYVWRRQLASTLGSVLAAADAGPDGAGPDSAGFDRAALPRVVGFADLTGFTALTRRLDESELRRVLELFESTAAEVVAARGGRVVKTIGDEVLFVVDAPEAAAGLALDLLERWEGLDDVPTLSVGLAYGPLVGRLGDVFGQPVNIASRLTSLARPGSALVDRELADALRDDAAFTLRSLRPESVRGYGHLHAWRLRRARDDSAADRR